MGLRQDLERAARRAPLVGRLLGPAHPAPAAARRRPVARRRAVAPAPSPPGGTEAPDLMAALDRARDRLRSAIPPRPDDE